MPLNSAKSQIPNCLLVQKMVNLVQSNWNILVEDFYRVRGIITVLYPTNYIPDISRTNEYEPKH